MQQLMGKPAGPKVVFKKYIGELRAEFSLRAVDPDTDSEMLRNWMNREYARRFWLQGRKVEEVWPDDQGIQDDPMRHALLVCADEQPIALVELYLVDADELKDHVDHQPNDAGLHLLMGPPREMQRGYSFYALKCVQQYYFSFEQSGDLYAEPDRDNYPANRLAKNTGFQFLKTVSLTEKTANVYRLTREQFFQ